MYTDFIFYFFNLLYCVYIVIESDTLTCKFPIHIHDNYDWYLILYAFAYKNFVYKRF